MMEQNVLTQSFFEQSADVAELAAALCSAQAKILKASKDSKNPFFKSSYADLASVWDAIRSPFTENGLSLTQHPIGENGLITTLLHNSGQYQRSFYFMRPVKDDPQGRGSCLTYMRRYAIMAISGVCPEDDDGNAASSPTKGKPTQHNGPSASQIKRLHAIAYSSKIATENVKDYMKKKYSVDSSKDLSIEQYNELCDFLSVEAESIKGA